MRKTIIGFSMLTLIALTSCTNHQFSSVTDDNGYNRADSIVNAIGDERDYPRVLAVTDSLERAGELPKVRAIFYSAIAHNLQGQRRAAQSLYNQLAQIDVKTFTCQADIETYIYSYKDYVRQLCDMRRYDRALREAYNADRKLKSIGYDSFVDHHDIAQMIGECQLYMEQTAEAAKSFERSLQGIHDRLAVHHDPLDLLECQKTMNAIARAYIHTGRYDEATPWMERQDSLYAEADSHPQRDSVYTDEMKAGINYSKALLAHAQGRTDDAEHAFSEYLSTHTAKHLGRMINSCGYLMLTHRYAEAARNYTQLDHFMEENGYRVDLENIGRYLLPKYRANLLAGHRDSALQVATLVAECYDSALVQQKISDADLLTTVYDTEGKERQIAEQRAKISHQRLLTVAIVTVLLIIFFHIYIYQRRKAYNKLNDTNRQLMLANKRAEESARMKTKFIQQISHEVRTPLNVLSGFSQVLAAPDIELSGDDLQSFSRKIVENSERITHLVDKMLDLSLVNSDTVIECHDTVNPVDVAKKAVELSGIRAASHLHFRLDVSAEAESLSFLTNQKAAVKALAQLLDNAAKFTHPLAFKGSSGHREEHVTLSVSVTQHQVIFVVEDTGIGIPAEQAENVFAEFVQLDEFSDGTGIGLSVARSLARHMNGDVILDTAYTAGARFVLSLPCRG